MTDEKTLTEKVKGAFKRWFVREQIYDFGLNTREIAGPLQFTNGGMFMWFVVGAQQWDFLPQNRRLGLWDQQAYRYSALANLTEAGETPIRMRITTRPYPAYEYARSLDEQTVEPLHQVVGAEGWQDFLTYGQRRLQSTGLDQKLVMLGVRLGDIPSKHVRRELLFGTDQPDLATVELIERMAKVERILSGDGFNATAASPRDMAFLFHRSLSMGVPAPVTSGVGGDRWEADDLAEFVDAREWHHSPLDPVVRIESVVNGNPVNRWVAVVSMGVMPDQQWPENGRDPWLLATSRLPFPVEVSLSGVLLTSRTLEKTITFEQNRAEGVAKHYAEHAMTPPPAVGRAIRGAASNLDEVTEGDSRAAARFAGTIRFAVVAPTEAEARRRANELVDFYGDKMKMPLAYSRDAGLVLREFVPGEPRSTHGYQRRMPVRYLAAGLPNVDQQIGTPTGPYFAYTAGSSRRAARFDLHYGPEVLNRSGLFPIVAELGAGKSVLIGSLAYNAVRCGIDTIILDPSGPLAKLCDLPELKPFSRVLDLTSSEPGTLSPFQMVPEVIRKDFVAADGTIDEVGYDRAVRRARSERQQLMFDVLRMWLPSNLLRSAGTDVILRDAIRAAAEQATEQGIADTAINPRWVRNKLEEIAEGGGTGGKHAARRNKRIQALVLDELRRRPVEQRDSKLIAHLASAPPLEAVHWAERHGIVTDSSEGFGGSALAQHILDEIDAAADFPLGELVMPQHNDPIPDDSMEHSKLVVITMPGLNPPPEGIEREFWGSEERYTQPLLHLAAFFASRFIYSRPRHVRKAIFLDENHLMSQWGSGRAFFVRIGRDSRKYDTAVGAASQHPDDHLSISRIEALMGGAFVGRLQNEDTAQRACKLLEAPIEYASVIQGLSPSRRTPPAGEAGTPEGQDSQAAAASDLGQSGEFVWRDPMGRIAKIRVDMDWHPSLRKALVTTPGRPRPHVVLTAQPTPFLDPELFDTIPVIPIETDRPGTVVDGQEDAA